MTDLDGWYIERYLVPKDILIELYPEYKKQIEKLNDLEERFVANLKKSNIINNNIQIEEVKSNNQTIN